MNEKYVSRNSSEKLILYNAQETKLFKKTV